MYKALKSSRIGVAATLMTAGVLATIAMPGVANAEALSDAGTATHSEITVKMIPTCAPEYPDCDLSEFVSGEQASTRGSVSGSCGTSTIYVDKIGTHKGRVSWGMHINTGFIVFREIAVAWGPAGGSSFADVSPMYSTNYSSSRTVSGSGNFSATIGGAVQLVGNKYVHCTIPFHSTSTIRI